MDEHERSTPEPDEAPQPRKERLMRLTLLALCLVGTVFGSTAAAAPFEIVDIELTSGQTSRPMNISSGSATLTLFGDQFALAVGLSVIGGFIRPSDELIPGTTITVMAGWVGDDATGVFTYQGQTRSLGTGHAGDPILDLQFLSSPFVVPPLDGSPVANVPFTLTTPISPTPTNPAFHLHGTGTMTFTFLGPRPDLPPPFGPAWATGEAQWFVTTPEPSAILLAFTALGGLGVCAWRRRRSRIPDTVDPRGPKGK
jgi:hypothetical protein